MPDQPPKEYIDYLAKHMRLDLSAGEMEVLEQVVQANEDYLLTVDASDRSPSEDPLGFMGFLRNWSGLQ